MKTRFRIACAAAVAAGLFSAPAASADQPEPLPKTPRRELRHDLPLDGAITGVMAGTVLVWGFVLKPSGKFGSDACTICDGPGTQVNAVDGWFRNTFKHDDIAPAATASHVLSYGVAPAAGVALTLGVPAADRRGNEGPLNALLVVEASLAAVLVKETASLAIRRERPEVHAKSGDEKQRALQEGDPMESFPSGHLASELAIMTAAGTIATMRGYRLAPLVWAVGGVLAGTIGYLRVAADQHYFTDNLAGAGIGIGVGAAVPLLFHRPVGARTLAPLAGAMVTSRPVEGGRTVSVGWAF